MRTFRAGLRSISPTMAAVEPEIILRPQPGPQELFLSCPADICIYGGAAGGGKTFAMLLEPLRHIANPRFAAVFFRRVTPEIRNPGGLWDESQQVYPLVGGVPREQALDWTFPSGASIKFAHLEHSSTVLDWKGAQVPLFCFDELTSFEESQFWYMLTRNRSTSGVRPYIRAGTNPDADSWVAKLIDWWIDPVSGFAIPERSGVIRYFVRINGQLVWGDTAAELEQAHNLPEGTAKSLTFIAAKLSDNKILMTADPTYLSNLLAQPLVEQERLLSGNWKIRPEAGKVVNRAWVEVVSAVPSAPGATETRGWDFAATAKEVGKKDPDYTAGIKMRRVGNVFYIVDCINVQIGPADFERTFVNTSRQDAAAARAAGARYRVRWEREPGSAGKREGQRLAGLLAGLDAAEVIISGDKLTRGAGFAAQCKAGNVKILDAPWAEQVLAQLHSMPQVAHDDIWDGCTVAFNDLVTLSRGVY